MTDITHVVDLSDDEDCVIKSFENDTTVANSKHSSLYEETKDESQLLANFIDKCLVIENSNYMFNTLKNILLVVYYRVEKSVRDGPKIQKALLRANNLLLNDPHHKFSHIKDLCEILKSSQVKKKVPFITLSTNLKTGGNHGVTNGQNQNNEVQLIDDCGANGQNPSNEVHIINEHDGLNEQNEVQIIDINCGINGLKRTHKDPIIATNNKKSKLITETPKPASNALNDCNDSIELLDDSTTEENCSQGSLISEDSLLVPKEGAPVDVDDPVDKANVEEIKKLERKIAFYKMEIARLEELEVDDDSVNSPYIRSERLKSSVVILYKQLCELTGHQPVKEREIRLQVIEGHPPGPTRILEAFLNKNIDSNGNLPFPDFCDVVNCVRESNVKDDLGWTETQIMNEAYMLFTHCGRALQKRRQQREYRDLLQRVKLEAADRDPADADPALLARLQENRRISEKKESEILERYTKMQALPSKTKSQKQQGSSSNTNDKTDKQNDTLNQNNNDIFENKMVGLNKEKSCENTEPVAANCDNESKDEPNTNIDHPNVSQKVKEKCSGEHDTDNKDKGPDEQTVASSETEAKNSDNPPIEQEDITNEIKQEPEEDIISMLQSLGENFSVTVETISEPFLIIEISDSSDEE